MSKKEGGEEWYDLEYKAAEDDAWYSVSVALDTVAETLTVKYLCSPEVYEVTFSAGDFKTEAEVEELARRFRPVSQQVQDNQCRQLAVGTTVCASHGTTQDDLRFYVAVIEAVNHQTHSFAGEEEECLCNFVLFWLHGRGREKVTSSRSISGLHSFGPGSKGSLSEKRSSCVSIEKNSESARSRLLGADTSMISKSLTPQNSWRTNDYEQWSSQDEVIGPQHCNIYGVAMGKGKHFMLIHNLEKDVLPSSIKKFIYKKTNILPQAFVFPRQLADPFARGTIVVDCPKKVQIIYEFLAKPNHIIVSSRGRKSTARYVENHILDIFTHGPAVKNKLELLTNRHQHGSLATHDGRVRSTIILDQDEIQCKGVNEEMKVIHSGTESSNRAKALRDLFVEYMHQESLVCNKLVLEEKKIWNSFKLGKRY